MRDDRLKTTIVLLPGMDGTGALFHNLIAALGDEFAIQVQRFPCDQALGYQALTDIVRAELPEGPFVLLGESFSGPIALALAAEQPPGLVGLVLCASFVRSPFLALRAIQPLLHILPMRQAPQQAIDYFLLGRFATPKLRQALRSAIASCSNIVLRARLSAIASIDASPLLAKIQVAMLYLQATEDRLVPPSAARLIQQLSPKTRIVCLPGPHCILQAAASMAASELRQFIHQSAAP